MSNLYARYLCSRDALGLKAEQPAGQARRATIGYLVYKCLIFFSFHYKKCNHHYKKCNHFLTSLIASLIRISIKICKSSPNSNSIDILLLSINL